MICKQIDRLQEGGVPPTGRLLFREVVFTVRANAHGAKRIERLVGGEFVRRYLLHVLPTGIKRIRHYGVLASACKTDKLQAARAALQMPPPNATALESAQAFMVRVRRVDIRVCPCCGVGHLAVVATLAAPRCLPRLLPTPSSRGPP